MKKLMTMSFVILFTVLTVLSYINFAYDSLEQIENDKQTIVIEKPNNITNDEFLTSIDSALGAIDQDIMYRYVDVTGDKPQYSYYKTNHTKDFIESTSEKKNFKVGENECISTSYNIEGYQVYDLNVSSLFQEFAFYDWSQASRYDLTSATYYVLKENCNDIANVIGDLGYTVTVNMRTSASGKLPVVAFAFIPSFLMVISGIFYTLSNGKKNVIKKMEGYTVKNILFDEIKSNAPNFIISFLLIEGISIIVSLLLFENSWLQYLLYAAKYPIGGLSVFLLGWIISILIIYTQNRAEYIKGKVPKKGIYYLAMLAKCIFIAFITFFMSIAIRNIQICYNTFQTSQFVAEKINHYVTVPINENNASSVGLEDSYLSFYNETVNKYNGIIVDSSNYQYDLTSGSTLAEDYGQDYIIVNYNYLSFNPIYDLYGKKIKPESFEKNKINILIPESKQDRKEEYQAFAKTAYSMEANFIPYNEASKIYSYNADLGMGVYGEIDSPVVIALQDELFSGIFILSYCSQGEYFINVEAEDPYKELIPILEETGIDKVTPQTPYISSRFADVLEQQFQMLILYGSQTLILTIGLICLIFFSSKLYCENYRQRIAISFCEGFSVKKCMMKHLIFTIILYVISMIAIWFFGLMINVSVNILLPVLALGFDTICIFALGGKYTRNNLYEVMKGAE